MDSNSVDPRHIKRLKVGRACYTCRAKKIKCDGLRPCMQCKARNRRCTFYKDGSFDPDDEQQQLQQQEEAAQLSTQETSHNAQSVASNNTTGDQTESHFLFAENKDASTRQRRRAIPLESRTGNILAYLGEGLRRFSFYDSPTSNKTADAEPFGSLIKWTLDAPLPSRYSGSIEMPSREAQLHLINIYYSELYESLPLVPPSYFYKQLQTKGPFITPLLLNAVYARVARFAPAHLNLPSSEVFFHRAKRLLDDFMDVPRVSTVVALCHMSLYEPFPQPNRPQGNQLCRAWMYGGMACRMGIELGLHSQRNISKDLPQEEIEIRRRVFWGCFVIDKLLSSDWERPWMLPEVLVAVDPPAVLEGLEDDPLENLLITKIRHMLKFLQIVEGIMMTLGISYQKQQQQQASPEEKEKLKEALSSFQSRVMEWLRSLPPTLQWTPTSELSVDNVLQLPPPRPAIAHLHLMYNVVYLDILLRQQYTAIHQFQQRIAATCITQLIHFLCQRPSTILKFDYLVHCAALALKVHSKYLRSSDSTLARQSWAMFDRSIQAIHTMRQYADIPNSAKFLQQLGSTPTDIQQISSNSNSASTDIPVTIPSQAAALMPDFSQQKQLEQRMALYSTTEESVAGAIYNFAQQQQQQSWLLLPALQIPQPSTTASLQQPRQQQQSSTPPIPSHPTHPPAAPETINNPDMLHGTPIVPSSTYIWEVQPSIQHQQHQQQREQEQKADETSLIYDHLHHQWSFQHE